MKLLANVGPDSVVFSVGHYDCRVEDGLLMDGGQQGCPNYAGYNRSNGQLVWIELPGVNFADLYNDYCQKHLEKRKYGYHKLSEVRILPPDEIPDVESRKWKVENSIWKTWGKDGKEKPKWVRLVDCDADHLQNILTNVPHLTDDTRKIIESILVGRSLVKSDF